MNSRNYTTKQSGFTLVETVVVMAVLGLLFTIVFIGQRQLRDRAEFDAGVDKIVQEFAYTRNFALSQVNTEGPGTNSNWVVAGAELELADHHPTGQLAELEPYYCDPGTGTAPGEISAACISSLNQYPGVTSACPNINLTEGECFELPFTDPGLSLTGQNEVSMIYLSSGGRVRACQPITDTLITEPVACAADMSAPYTFKVTNGNGYTADIQIDPSGIARRLN